VADETTEVPTTSPDLDEARGFFELAAPVGAGVGAAHGGGSFPPPPPAAPVAPQLPTVAAPPPAANPVAASPFASAMEQQWAPGPAPQPSRRSRGGARRTVSWLLVLAVLGGLGWAGFTYGPDLLELADGDESLDEPSAALIFPPATAVATPVRTATFTVDTTDAAAGARSETTTIDFETGVSRTVITGPDATDLEVLTLWNTAFVRRVDQPIWYRVEQGAFPADAQLGPTRWVRTLDQLFPPTVQATATIVEATESAVGTQPARRLLVDLDPASLTVADDVASPLPPGVALGQRTDATAPVRVEVWVDPTGLIRKSILPTELGGETITVSSVSPDEWLPVFPTEDMVRPITAAAMLELGL